MAEIVTMFPDDVAIVRPGGRWRSRLRLTNGLIISALVARPIRPWRRCWRVDPLLHECEYVTLLARLNEDNRSFLDFHVFPRMDRRERFDLSLNDLWLNRREQLSDLSNLCGIADHVNAKRMRM
jgi:hypothetical protein